MAGPAYTHLYGVRGDGHRLLGDDVRIITWNMGCGFGGRYRSNHLNAWRQIEELDPDVALLQEVASIPDWADPSRIIVAKRNEAGTFLTVVYARRGSCELVAPDASVSPLLGSQAVIAEVTGLGEPLLVASVHTRTGRPKEPELSMFHGLDPEVKGRLDLPSDSGSWNASIICSVIEWAAGRRNFVAGGDFNLAWRFDETDPRPTGWASDQFKAMRDAGWRRPHLKFHAGEERTLFRRPLEIFQLDHFFCDAGTYGRATACDVIHLDDLEELSDHAPLGLTFSSLHD